MPSICNLHVTLALRTLVAVAAKPAANAEVIIVKHGHGHHNNVERSIAHHERVVKRDIIRHIRHDYPDKGCDCAIRDPL